MRNRNGGSLCFPVWMLTAETVPKDRCSWFLQRPRHTDTPCGATTDCPCASCLPSAFRRFHYRLGKGPPNWPVVRGWGIARSCFPLRLPGPRPLLDQCRVLCPSGRRRRLVQDLVCRFPPNVLPATRSPVRRYRFDEVGA